MTKITLAVASRSVCI